METKSLVKQKKAQIGNKIATVVTVIITVVILFSLFADLVPEVQTAGTEFQDSDVCGEAGGFFNSSQGLCLNGTTPGDTAQVSFSAIPLGGLFSSTGVVIILLMIFLLLLVLKIVLPSRK